MTEEGMEGQVQETEARARTQGWVPKDEFKGNPEKWIPAAEYVNRAEQEMPILRGTLRTMETKMAIQERTIRELNQQIGSMAEGFKEVVERSRKGEERAYQRALADLKAEQRKAAEDGDIKKFDEVSAEIDRKIEEHPAITGKPKEEKPEGEKGDGKGWLQPEVYAQWESENPWILESFEMAQFAQWQDGILSKKHPEYTHAQRLAEITKKVREKFPDYFGITRPAGASGSGTKPRGSSPVEGGDDAGPSDSKFTYANLPPEDRKKCDEYTGKDGKGESGSIPGFTREEYVRVYFMGER